MVFKSRVTEAFEDDLVNTLRYLSERLASPRAAENLMHKVDVAEELLICQPFLHAVSRKPNLHSYDCRECLVDNYVIVYRVVGDEVVFLRLFHQTQLYDRLIDMSQEGGLA